MTNDKGPVPPPSRSPSNATIAAFAVSPSRLPVRMMRLISWSTLECRPRRFVGRRGFVDLGQVAALGPAKSVAEDPDRRPDFPVGVLLPTPRFNRSSRRMGTVSSSSTVSMLARSRRWWPAFPDPVRQFGCRMSPNRAARRISVSSSSVRARPARRSDEAVRQARAFLGVVEPVFGISRRNALLEELGQAARAGAASNRSASIVSFAVEMRRVAGAVAPLGQTVRPSQFIQRHRRRIAFGVQIPAFGFRSGRNGSR